MKKTLNKGFTLIELLVVIAIIGILASVILASLNSARAKGTDAAIKSDLENARPQAEIFYDASSSTYSGVCSAATSANPGGIQTMLDDAASKFSGSGVVAIKNGAVQTPNTVNCNDGANAAGSSAWAASAPLKADAGFYWCVDSTGKAEKTATPLPASGASGVVCP